MKTIRISPIQSSWMFPWFFCLTFLTLAVWAFILFDLERLYKHTTDQSRVQIRSLARLYAEEVTSSINMVDFVTRDLRDHWHNNPLEYAALVQSRQVYLDPSLAFSVSIVDAAGNFVFTSSDWKTPKINISDRAYFQFHRTNRKDELYISAPVIGRLTNRWAVLFTRPFIEGSGSFKGVTVVAVSPEYFSRFHQRIDLGPGSSISLVRKDGKMIARYPNPELALGHTLAGAPFLETGAPQNGFFLKASEIDGVERQFSWHALDDSDLVVVIGQSTTALYEQYRYQRTVYLWSGAIISLGFLAIGIFIFINFRRREKELIALKEMEKALVRSQKLEAVGQMTGGVAHDFNNILQIISGNVQMLEAESNGNSHIQQRLKTTLDAVDRGTRLASQLLSFARRKPLQTQMTHAGERIRKIDSLIQRLVGEGVELDIRFPDDLWNTQVDADLMENVILNLSANARDAMNGQGKLTIELSNETVHPFQALAYPDMPAGEYIRIRITDTGSGMPPEVLEHAFEPFFTTKPEGKGTGLGLSMAYGFVRQSGGHIYISTQLGQGTTFEIFLPRSP